MGQRSADDAATLTAIFRSGQFNRLENTASTPIVDERACTNHEIHSRFHSFKLRERLRNATRSDVNHLLLIDKPAADSRKCQGRRHHPSADFGQ